MCFWDEKLPPTALSPREINEEYLKIEIKGFVSNKGGNWRLIRCYKQLCYFHGCYFTTEMSYFVTKHKRKIYLKHVQNTSWIKYKNMLHKY